MGKIFCLPVFSRKYKMKSSPARQSVTSEDSGSPATKPGDHGYFQDNSSVELSTPATKPDHGYFEDNSSIELAKTTNDSLSNSMEEEIPSPVIDSLSNDVVTLKDDVVVPESEVVDTPSQNFVESEVYLSDPGPCSCATSEGSHNDNLAGLRDYEEYTAPVHPSEIHEIQYAIREGSVDEEIQHEIQQVQEGSRGDHTTFSRVEQWVQSIENVAEPLDEQVEMSTPKSYTSSTHERTVNHKDLELANNVARALDFHAPVAHLSGIGLTVIPSLGAFGNLRVLKLSANSITKISLGSLPKSLQFLDLSRNKISVIEGLRELTRLRIVILSNNKILRIGKGLANCTSIRELHLAGNKISEVEGLHRLSKLHFLDLSFNKLASTKSLEQIAASYSSLLALDLVGNPVVVNVGEDHLKRFVLSLTPSLVYLNRKPVNKNGAMPRDAALLLKTHIPSSTSLLSSSRYSPSAKVINGKKNHRRDGMQRVKSEGSLHE